MRGWLACAALCLAAAPAAAQGRWETFVRPGDYTALEADSASIWLASVEAGLLRFDPATTRFEFFNRLPNQLISNELTALAFDGSGRLWVGTLASGVSVRSADGASWRLVSRLDQLPSDSVTALAPDGDNLWIGTRAGLAFWNGSGDGSVDAFWPNEDEAPFASNFVNDVVVVDTTVWVATAAGVYRNSAVRAGSWTAVNAGLPSLDVRSLGALADTLFAVSAGQVYRGGETGSWSDAAIPSPAARLRGQRGRLLASSAGGIFRREGAGWLFMPHLRPPGVPPGPGGVVLVDRDGVAWSANPGGLWRNVSVTEPDSLYWRNYVPNAPVGNNFVNVLVDGDRIYATVDGTGVTRFDGATWTNWTAPCPGCPDGFLNPYQGVGGLVDAGGRKWIGFWSSVLERFDDRGPAPVFTHLWPQPADPESLKHTWSWATCVDSSRRVWIGNDTPSLGFIEPIGLDLYSPDTFVANYQTNNSALRGNQIRALTVDRFGNVWVGYAGKGVDVFNAATGPTPGNINVVIAESDPFPDVFGLVANGDDLWVMTTATLERWSILTGQRVFEARLPAAPANKLAVHPLDVDARGDAWVATQGGLYRYLRDRSDSTLYTKANYPLVGDEVRGVVADRARDALWIATTTGLNRFEPRYAPPPPPPLPSLAVTLFPNPARLTEGGIRLRLLGNASSYVGAIYDLRGRRVRRFATSQGGTLWDGRDDEGHRVAPGVYFVRVEAGGRVAKARVVLLR